MWLIFKRRLLYPLSKIVRRIKKMLRESVLINIGVMIVPVGLVLAIEAINHDDGKSSLWPLLGLGGIIISFIGLALIFVLLRDAKRKDKENQIQQDLRDEVLKGTLSELKGLRQDLTQGGNKNGRSKNNPV
jgi:putative Mn2+ efflux pump MntP